VLRVQLSSELASTAFSTFSVMGTTEGGMIMLLRISDLHCDSKEFHFSETYNYLSHNNRGKLLLFL
jgi:hypothetical protein